MSSSKNSGPPVRMSLPFSAFAAGGQNGRVNLIVRPSAGGPGEALADPILGNGRLADASAFPGFGYQTKVETSFQGDMLRGNWEQNPLSDAFFSKENVKTIQNAIRKSVFERSQPKGYVIDDQSVDELKIIMRAIYYQYAKHLPYDLVGQISDLNQKVLDWSVPHILSAADHYMYYINDIEHMPVPLERSIHMSRAGTKSLPLQPFM